MRCCSHCIWWLSGLLSSRHRVQDRPKTGFTRSDSLMSFELLSWLISPVDLPGSLNFFHAGTSLMWNGTLVTTGGRVMTVSATADSLEAVKLAYTGVSMV